MEIPGIYGQFLLEAVETTGLPLSQQAAATHISVLIQQHPEQRMLCPGPGMAPSGSPLTQGPTGPGAFQVLHCLPWESTHGHSSTQLLCPPLNTSLCSVFQAFPLEPLCCWWGRPGPFWVSMALEAHPTLPLGGVGWLETTGTASSQVSPSGDGDGTVAQCKL